jgi:cellulose synthase/poly-beta-1,6-N-acetylglucosamine synthase-like glycosyltransferase
MIEFLVAFNVFVFGYFLVLNGTYLILIFLGWQTIRRRSLSSDLLDHEQMIQSPLIRPVSIIAAAYNEEASIVSSVHSLLKLQYPKFEVVVVNDGSTDSTLDLLRKEFELHPSVLVYRHQVPCAPIRGIYVSAKYPDLVVVDKVNGGSKADTSNAGLNVARHPLVCVIDADSLLPPDALLNLVRPFFEDPRTLASGGSLRVLNGCKVDLGRITEIRLPKNWLACVQALEYLRAYLYGRLGWDRLGATLIISGGCGMFDRAATVAVGGYDSKSLGEDFDMVCRLQDLRYRNFPERRITFVPESVCWTEVPETLTVYRRQRSRWMRGLIDVLRNHRSMILNPKRGMVGMVAMPYYILFELLAPFIETTGYIVFILCWALGLLNYEFVFWFLAVSVFLGILLSAAAVSLMLISTAPYKSFRDVAKLMACCVIEGFGVRQLHNIYRIYGAIEYLQGKRGWGVMTRVGAAPTAPLAQ